MHFISKQIGLMRLLIFPIGLVFLLSSCVSWFTPKVELSIAQLEPGNYRLDPSHSSVLFKAQHLGLSTYVGRFNRMEAELVFDPEQPLQTQLTARVFTESVDVNNPDLEETLRDSSWFNAEEFPVATLTTLSVEPAEKSNQFVFNAELELKGVKRPVKLLAIFHGGADNWLTGYYTMGFSAQTTITRSGFGIDNLIPMVGDQVDIEIYAEFQKRSN